MHRIDQRADAQHVGQQDELLAERRAGLADRGEELDAGQPFRRRQAHVSGEGVQVPHRRVHDLLQARIRRVRHLRQCGFGDGVFVKVLHGTLLWLGRLSIAHRLWRATAALPTMPAGCTREDLLMATARHGRALAAALLLLVGFAQTMAIPVQKIGVSRVPDKSLSASLVLPDGPGPFPAVIAALVLDSFSARGVTTVCAPQAQHLVTAQDRVADVFSAALYLRAQPRSTAHASACSADRTAAMPRRW